MCFQPSGISITELLIRSMAAPDGDPAHPQSSFDAEWDDVRAKAKIEHRRFHDLRHSYITRCAEAGIPLSVVQAQVGHMSAAMTEHYTHVSEAAVHKAAKQLERESADLLKRLGLEVPPVESAAKAGDPVDKSTDEKTAPEEQRGSSGAPFGSVQ